MGLSGDDCVVFIDVGLNNGTNKKERNKERKVKRKEWIIRVGYASGDDLSTPSNLPLHVRWSSTFCLEDTWSLVSSSLS